MQCLPESGGDHGAPFRLSALTRKRIRCRVDRLVRIYGLNEQDGEDLFQDFAFEVLKAEVRYDPERGSYDAFVRGVLDLAYKHFARRLSTRSGRVPRLHPPEDLEASVSASWCPSDISSCDLRVDVQGTIDGLDPETAELAVRLKHQSVAEAAEAMGTHRGTAHRWIAQKLRIAFKSLRPGK